MFWGPSTSVLERGHSVATEGNLGMDLSVICQRTAGTSLVTFPVVKPFVSTPALKNSSIDMLLQVAALTH